MNVCYYRILLIIITITSCTSSFGQITKAKEFAKIATLQKQAPSFQRDTLIIASQNEIITIYLNEQKIDSARMMIQDTEDKLKKINWERGWGFFLRNRGQYYTFALQKDLAVADFIKSIQIWEKLKHWRQAGIASARLGNALLMDLKFDKSLFYLNNALKAFEEHNDYFSQCNTLNYLSNVYRSMNDYKRALEMHRRVIYLVKTHKLDERVQANKNIAMSYLFNNMIDSSKIFFLKDGIDIDKNVEKINDCYTYNRLCEYYKSINQPQKVIETANLCLKIAVKNNATAYMRTAHELLYEGYKDSKSYDLALKHYILSKNITDSLEKKDVTLKLNQLEVQYQTQKKETEIEKQKALLEANKLTILGNQSKVDLLNKNLLLNNEIVARQTADKQLKTIEFEATSKVQKANIEKLSALNLIEKQKQTRNLLLAGLAFSMLLAGFAFFNNRKLRQKNQEISDSVLKGQTIERKRVAADLHDNLGSTMSSLIWTLEAINTKNLHADEQNIYKSLKKMLHDAYNEVRFLSHNLLPEEFEKQGLTQSLKHFVRKINQNSSIKFDLNMDENLGRLDKKVEFELYSICLELVTNITKHSKATEAKISLAKLKNQIKLIVEDNGTGIFENNSDGKGMKNVRARVDSLDGKWNLQNTDNHGVRSEIIISA